MAKLIGKPVTGPKKKRSGMPSSGTGKGRKVIQTKKAIKKPSKLELKADLFMQQQRPRKVTSAIQKPSKPKNNRDPRNRYSTGGQVSYKHGEMPKAGPC